MASYRARTAHRVRGRIRLTIHGAKGRPHALEHIKKSITPIEGVRNIETDAATGSVVVHYDPAQHHDFHEKLAKQGSSTGAFQLDPPILGEGGELVYEFEEEAEFLSQHSDTARFMVDSFKSLDQAIKRATNNAVDLKVLLPLGLAVYSFLEFGVEVSTPLWVTLGIFSFNSFLVLHSPHSAIASESDDTDAIQQKNTASAPAHPRPASRPRG
jgi:cation transport ATPase